MLVLGLVDVPWWAFLILLLIVSFIYDARDFDYFKKQGIPGPRPFPIVGTSHTLFTKSFADTDFENFKKYGDRPCYGEFLGSAPVLVVSDEEMLSDIMVKQFSTFTNRQNIPSGDPITNGTLFSLGGSRWKHVRNEMTPTFTTGKLKKMNSEINRCAKTLVESMVQCAKEKGEIDCGEYAGGFTMDVIASTGFGIRVESQKDRNNAFVDHARRAFVVNSASPMFIILNFFPKVAQLMVKLGVYISIIPQDIMLFFTNVTRQIMEKRRSDEDQSRTDFLQLMLKAQKGENIHDEGTAKDEVGKTTGSGMTTDEILGNALVFFSAGYDTTATTISFLLYNMALYPDIQEKLMKEITQVAGDKEDIDAAIINNMPFLDQCVNESLRIYPLAPRINRRASHDIDIKGVHIRKDLIVNIPIFAIHRDPKKWPNPDRFDPDRFLPENKKDQNPYHYMPFGNGPRHCIGMRLALQEIKVAVVHVLRKLKFSKCQKTPIPMVFDKGANLLKAAGGIHLKLELRA